MQAADVALIVTNSHVELRRMLDRLDALVETAGAHGIPEVGFNAHCEKVKRALLAHMELEEALIVPLLRALPNRGKSEAESLIQHHETQRRWLSNVLDNKKDVPCAETLRAIQTLSHMLRVDMDYEEATFAHSAKQAPRSTAFARHR